MGIEQVFSETRVRRKKRVFDYEFASGSSRLLVEEPFISLFFFVLPFPRFYQLVDWYI